jgi:hypothetical protein
MDDRYKYFKKIMKNLHSATCQILMDGWKMTLVIKELHSSWKGGFATKL